MKKLRLLETFTEEVTVNFNDGSAICESGDSSLIDGQYIIGMVEGQFFQPDGMSRNKRWYSRNLWENVLANADVKNRLLNRTMFGEIGHSDGPVTDMTLRNGEASHIISDLWIDEKGRGMGRAYILNTKTGRDLKIYLGAGAKLKVSTRGEGVYLDGEYHDGCPVIDPDTYELQTVDFVLNPGFLETSAKMTAQKESVEETSQQIGKVNETIAQNAKKEGEKGMALDMDAYVAELKDELKALKAENKSLTEELKTKDKELLEKQFVESAEIKKINEEFEPYKKMGVSAKTLNETLKRSQKALKDTKAENAKLTEELNAFKDVCGSIEQVEEATKMSEKALNAISEYQKLGTVEELKELVKNSEALLPKLEQLSVLTEYRKLGSVKDLTALTEKCAEALPKLKSLNLLEDYKKLGSIDEIKSVAKNSEVLLGKLAEAEELGKTVEKILPRLDRVKALEDYAVKAHSVIEKYISIVGNLKQARTLAESKKETIKKVNVREALDVSRKFGCTVESAAKLIKKYGAEKASKLLESATTTQAAPTKKLAESKELVEEVAQMDKVNAKPETKTAKDFVSTGMVNNAFNLDAFGKKMDVMDLNKLNGEICNGTEQAKDLLKKYQDLVQVAEPAPAVEEPNTAVEAEAEAKKLLK